MEYDLLKMYIFFIAPKKKKKEETFQNRFPIKCASFVRKKKLIDASCPFPRFENTEIPLYQSIDGLIKITPILFHFLVLYRDSARRYDTSCNCL